MPDQSLDEIHPRSYVATATREKLKGFVLQQADSIRRWEAAYRELQAELRAVGPKVDGLRETAMQYARAAGVEVLPEDLDAHGAEFREMWARYDRTLSELEGRRWEALRLVRELEDVAAGARVTDLDVCAFAKLVADRFAGMLTVQTPKRHRELFARPAAPGLGGGA